MSSEEGTCQVCKDWPFETLANYKRANGHGCPRCGQDGDMIAWLRTQVDADAGIYRSITAQLGPLVTECDSTPGLTESYGLAVNRAELARAREGTADCEAKLALLDAYGKSAAGGDLGYDYRTGRHSYAESLWNALSILSGGYRHREGWREHWPKPQTFQGN
jgi:hypothetical protein